MKQEPGTHKRKLYTESKKAPKADGPLSASKIKKRIRDVKRTLAGGKHVSAQVITESKRRLRVLQFELGERTIDEAERVNATKYHKIRHFERKKAERKVKTAKKNLEAEKDESKKKELQDKLNECELKSLYTLHFPKTLHYVSLFPKENGDDPKSVARKERVLNDIKEALATGDSDFKAMEKRYRDDYKQKLIQKGTIPPETPVDEQDVDMLQNENEKQVKDEFFE